MSNILSFYIVREHVGPFLFGFFVVMLLFVLNLLFKDLAKFLSKGISLPVILEFLYLNLAWMIALAVPMAVLSATLMAFGRLAADNEITAMKAGGISLYQILPAVLLVAGALGAGLVWFNNTILPELNHRAKLLALDIARKKPMINLEPGVYYTDIPNYNIMVRQIDERDGVSYVEDVLIDDQAQSNVTTTIWAKRGTIWLDRETGMLEITLFDGELQRLDYNELESLRRSDFSKHVIRIPMSDVLLRRSESGYRGDREKSVGALLAEVQENRKRIEESLRKLNHLMREHWRAFLPWGADSLAGEITEVTPANAGRPGLRVVANDSGAASDQEVILRRLVFEQQRLRRQIEMEINQTRSYRRSINKDMVEVHKKYSIPAACLVFVLVGAPLGTMARQRGLGAAALSIVFFLVYWACLIGGETLADRQIVSAFWAMWSPNILVGFGGIALVLFAVRETYVFHWFDAMRGLSRGARLSVHVVKALVGAGLVLAGLKVINSRALETLSPWFILNLLLAVFGVLLILHSVRWFLLVRWERGARFAKRWRR